MGAVGAYPKAETFVSIAHEQAPGVMAAVESLSQAFRGSAFSAQGRPRPAALIDGWGAIALFAEAKPARATDVYAHEPTRARFKDRSRRAGSSSMKRP
jgi:threonine dehydrogenase-like Zn-dependent dehydrogenase